MTLFITLSSIPARFDKIGPVLESLASQGADKVLLYIPETYRRFPDWDGALPKVPSGIQIQRCTDDLGLEQRSCPPRATSRTRMSISCLPMTTTSTDPAGLRALQS